MQESIEVERLRQLLGDERFKRERLKGEQLRKESTQMREEAPRREGSNEGPSGDEGQGEAMNLCAGQYVNASTSLGPSGSSENSSHASKHRPDAKKPGERFKAPWSDSEESESDSDQYEAGGNAPVATEFCPILAASRYPYKVLADDKEYMEAVAKVSFNNGQFWKRRWSVFYVICRGVNSDRPVMLIPRTEMEKLLLEAGEKLNTTLTWPSNSTEPGFSISFTAKEPNPIFLGTSRSREQYDQMSEQVSASEFDKSTLRASFEDNHWATFRDKVEVAVKAAKGKRPKGKVNSKKERAMTKSDWHAQLLKSQRYLGLRPVAVQDESNVHAQAMLEFPPDIDVSTAPAFDFKDDTVFVAIDIEAHERNPNIITEIGISTLDTRMLRGVAPGQAATKWRDLIRYRHFRVEEHRHHRNFEFITGCPDRFEEAFGTSEFIRKTDIPRAVALCCKPPFPQEIRALLSTNESSCTEGSIAQLSDDRKVVLVGHDLAADLRYLKSVGFEPQHLSGVIDILDTSMIHRALVQDNTPVSLANLLHLLGISAWNLHNAGNDAGYTMQALLAIAVEHLANPQYRNIEIEIAKRRNNIAQAESRACKDDADWLEILKQNQ